MNVLAAIVVLTNLAYTAAFDTETRCPAWVAYDLEPCEVVVTNRAAIPFRADPRVKESDNAADYAGSGYDRGHLAPAADFNFDRAALDETYYFTNICPQDPVLNRGAWGVAEAEVRRLAASGTVHVVTFPVFDDACYPGVRRIGRTAVPTAFVKVAYGWFGVRHWRFQNVEWRSGWNSLTNQNKEIIK